MKTHGCFRVCSLFVCPKCPASHFTGDQGMKWHWNDCINKLDNHLASNQPDIHCLETFPVALKKRNGSAFFWKRLLSKPPQQELFCILTSIVLNWKWNNGKQPYPFEGTVRKANIEAVCKRCSVYIQYIYHILTLSINQNTCKYVPYIYIYI